MRGRNNKSGVSIIAAILMVIFVPIGTCMAQGFTPEHLAKLQYVYDADISPDGRQIAYTKLIPRNPFVDENGKAFIELHVTDTEGNSRPYITGKVRIFNPTWSPDGKYIAYRSEREGDDDIALYIIPAEGGESRKLVELDDDIQDISWSPDSRTIAIRAKDTCSARQEELDDHGFNQKIYEEDWRHYRIWLVDINDSAEFPRKIELDESAYDPVFSPDGSKLALSLAPTPLVDDRYMFRRVAIIDPQSGEILVRFKNPGKLGDIAWSPDGRYLAIVSGRDIHDPREGEIYLLPSGGGDMVPVLTDFNGHVDQIHWLDTETILFHADVNVHSVVGTIKIDGSVMKTLIPESRPVYNNIFIDKAGKNAALVGSSSDYPGELFYYRIDKGEPRRLTVSNKWLDDLTLGKQEVINYTARDGLELQGILIYPINYQEGQSYPTILSVHGGPEANRTDSWLTWYSGPGQMAAAEGYAVFYPNYRGSTGRGVEFSMMGQADYAGKEFDDLVDAVDHLIEMGITDRNKVGITGGSYGGYATAWASTALSEHFAAGVMAVGVSDLLSKFGTTDIPMEMYYVHARNWPWEKWQWYLERSPIYYARKAQTPLLILHGEDDTRVHPSQSMELYRYLKTLGNVPVRLIFYKDEGHGNKRAASRYDYNLRMMRWFDHYLKGDGGDPPDYELDYSRLKPEDK